MKKAGWLKDGIATPRGIVTAHGEMLKRRKMSEAQINEWNGFEKKTVASKPKPNLESMTKDELEALGREHDIELDKREKKASLIDVLKYVVKR
jgi:hypothetical protein